MDLLLELLGFLRRSHEKTQRATAAQRQPGSSKGVVEHLTGAERPPLQALRAPGTIDQALEAERVGIFQSVRQS